MQKLEEYIKAATKLSICVALILCGYVLIQNHTKYPFTAATKKVNETLTQVIPADNSNEKDELLYSIQPVLKPAPVAVKAPEAAKPVATNKVAFSKKKKELIVLGKRNTLVFRGVVTQLSVAQIQAEAMAMSSNLSPSEPIYLVLDTPGGDVIAGSILIDTLRALPNKVHTITLFAASMGFHIVESLDDRLILDSGTLMSHRMSISGIEGQVPGEAVTRLNQAVQMAERMDKEMAKRMGLTFEEYRAKIENELWLDGQDSVDANAADRTVYASCGEDMRGTHDEHMQVLFFNLLVTFSDCPLIRFPVKIQQLDSKAITSSDAAVKQAEYVKYFNTLMYDKEKFVRDYISTGKYKEFSTNN